MRGKSSDPARRLLLLDTHVVLWAALQDGRLGNKTTRAINQAAREDCLLVSAITPWEIGLLASKSRINLHRDVLQWIREMLEKPGINLVPLSPEIAVGSNHLPFEMHGDPADRILVATARHLGATLVTADGALLKIEGRGHFAAMDAGK